MRYLKLLWARWFYEWRVFYHETRNYSRPMSYRAAREYATIFRGDVRPASEFQPKEF
jgi:hypothetical protein